MPTFVYPILENMFTIWKSNTPFLKKSFWTHIYPIDENFVKLRLETISIGSRKKYLFIKIDPIA